LCGTHLGPPRYLSSSNVLDHGARKLYSKLASANEFYRPKSLTSWRNDQVVAIIQVCSLVSHPLILRDLYINGDAHQWVIHQISKKSPDFTPPITSLRSHRTLLYCYYASSILAYPIRATRVTAYEGLAARCQVSLLCKRRHHQPHATHSRTAQREPRAEQLRDSMVSYYSDTIVADECVSDISGAGSPTCWTPSGNVIPKRRF